MTNTELDFILDAIAETAAKFRGWAKDYSYDTTGNEYVYKHSHCGSKAGVDDGFAMPVAPALKIAAPAFTPL